MSDRTDLRDRLYEKLCKEEKRTTYYVFWSFNTQIINTATRRYNYQKVIGEEVKEKVLKKHLSIKIARIAQATLCAFIICFVVFLMRSDGGPAGDDVVPFIIFNLVMVIVILGILLSLKERNDVRISSQQLQIRDRTLLWDNILDMYIVVKPLRYSKSKFNSFSYTLALLLDTDEIVRYPLKGYSLAAEEFTWEVSAYLEHFRRR